MWREEKGKREETGRVRLEGLRQEVYLPRGLRVVERAPAVPCNDRIPHDAQMRHSDGGTTVPVTVRVWSRSPAYTPAAPGICPGERWRTLQPPSGAVNAIRESAIARPSHAQ